MSWKHAESYIICLLIKYNNRFFLIKSTWHYYNYCHPANGRVEFVDGCLLKSNFMVQDEMRAYQFDCTKNVWAIHNIMQEADMKELTFVFRESTKFLSNHAINPKKILYEKRSKSKYLSKKKNLILWDVDFQYFHYVDNSETSSCFILVFDWHLKLFVLHNVSNIHYSNNKIKQGVSHRGLIENRNNDDFLL